MSKTLSHNAVQVTPASDAWISGDRYGAIVARRDNGEVLVRMDKSQKLYWCKPADIVETFSRV